MGKILQKKKRRSSVPKASQKQRSKKRHLANAIIASGWNKSETLSQNYRRLGLVSKLNRSSGGVERVVTGSRTADGVKEHLSSKPDNALIIEKGQPTELEVDEARVERDPETGRILQVLSDSRPNPLQDPLNDLEDSDEEELSAFLHVPQKSGTETEVIKALEERASNGRRKEPRKQSNREQEWIQRLIAKHGDNYKAMFRDAKLNPMQQSVGDIRARVKKYLQTETSG